MYTVPPSPSAVSLFSRSGLTRVFSSLRQAYRELGYAWIAQHVRAQFIEFTHVERYADATLPAHPLYQRAAFILRDDAGAALTAGDFNPFLPSYTFRRFSRFASWNGEGPVPGTAKRRGGRSYYRRIGTMSERRAAQAFSEYGEPAPRAARSSSYLPNSWDDIQRSRQGNGWKRQRSHQWKEPRT